LEFYESKLTDHRRRNGTELGFHLDSDQCQSLREEAVMYYHRYLSLFVLEDFAGVVRDTARNLRVLDLCGKYAEEEQDRLVLEQYRPYITMMNARAQASLLVEAGRFDDALKTVEHGMSDIRNIDIRRELETLSGKIEFAWIRQAVKKVDDLVMLVRRNIQKTIALDAVIIDLRG